MGRKAGPAGERSGAGAARRSPAGWCAQLGRVPPSSPAAENVSWVLPYEVLWADRDVSAALVAVTAPGKRRKSSAVPLPFKNRQIQGRFL